MATKLFPTVPPWAVSFSKSAMVNGADSFWLWYLASIRASKFQHLIESLSFPLTLQFLLRVPLVFLCHTLIIDVDFMNKSGQYCKMFICYGQTPKCVCLSRGKTHYQMNQRIAHNQSPLLVTTCIDKTRWIRIHNVGNLFWWSLKNKVNTPKAVNVSDEIVLRGWEVLPCFLGVGGTNGDWPSIQTIQIEHFWWFQDDHMKYLVFLNNSKSFISSMACW